MGFSEFILLEDSWKSFLEREENKEFLDNRLIKKIKKTIKDKSYLKFSLDFLYNFKLPKIKEIRKHNTSKRRIVYVYPEPYNLVLKIMSHYILLNYNSKFCINSLAYVRGKSVKTAFSLIRRFKLKKRDIVYKNDFSDYFNSIDVYLLEDKLKNFLGDDLVLLEIIIKLLKNPKIIKGREVIEVSKKGVMAGSPISGILANIFMDDVDKLMLKRGHKYIRYADDTLVVGEKSLEYFTNLVKDLGIELNPKKVKVMTIKDGITFLGFFYKGKKIDISDEARDKMKSRFKRRAKWYRQWMLRKQVKKEVALRDYILKINRKLYTDEEDGINWTRWYLPCINNVSTLKYLDNYFVDCIRYLDSGTWTKGKLFYRLSYKDIKNLGYRSLVNEYYKTKRKSGK